MQGRDTLEKLHDELNECLFLVCREIRVNYEFPGASQKAATRTAGWGTSLFYLLLMAYNWEAVAEALHEDGIMLGFVLTGLVAYPALYAEKSIIPASRIQQLSDLPAEMLKRVNALLQELRRWEILPDIHVSTPISNVVSHMQHAFAILKDMCETARREAGRRRVHFHPDTMEHGRMFTLGRHILPERERQAQPPKTPSRL